MKNVKTMILTNIDIYWIILSHHSKYIIDSIKNHLQQQQWIMEKGTTTTTATATATATAASTAAAATTITRKPSPWLPSAQCVTRLTIDTRPPLGDSADPNGRNLVTFITSHFEVVSDSLISAQLIISIILLCLYRLRVVAVTSRASLGLHNASISLIGIQLTRTSHGNRINPAR